MRSIEEGGRREFESNPCLHFMMKEGGSRVHVASWNINGIEPPEGHEGFWREWLGLDRSPDITVIGLQEINWRGATHECGSTTRIIKQWSKTLAEHCDGKLVDVVEINGVVLFVFSRIVLRHTAVSVLPFSDKGAAGWRGRTQKGTSFCVINCHLTAGQNAVIERNKEIERIMDEMRFPAVFKPTPKCIKDHDVVIMFGDLNYRLDCSFAEATSFCEHGKFQELLHYDQLIEARQPRSVISSFQTGPISHPPTYKYRPGTTVFDQGRVPSYCDRILFMGCVDQENDVMACMDMLSSDHRPIHSTFLVREGFMMMFRRLRGLIDSLRWHALL